MDNDSRNYIQQLIKDLNNKMDIITSQLRLLFDFVDKFKHKRHLIIYSYLLGYYASKGNENFNENILFDSLEIFNKSLTRKTELSNLIIAVSLSINKKEKKETKVAPNDDFTPWIDITETMLSNDPYSVYKDLFGDTVFEKPLSGTIINKLNRLNSKNIQNNNQNQNNNEDKNEKIIIEKKNINIIENNNQNFIEKKNNNILEKNIQKPNKELYEINENIDDDNDNINKEKDKNNIINSSIVEKGINKNNKINKNNIKNDFNKNTHKNREIKLNPQGPQDTIPKNRNYNTNTLDNTVPKKFEQIIGNQPKNAKKKMIKCFICSDNFNELDKLNYKLDCKCIIHHKCFNNYIKNAIKSHEIPILCPKCKKEINTENIYKSLNSIGDKLLIKDYEKLYFDVYIKNYEGIKSDIVYYCCPTPGCEKNIPCKNNETKLSCPHCHKDYCIRCYRPWHQNKKCEEYVFKNSKNNNNELNKEFYDILTNSKYRECPKCKALMVKEEGTNKILCVCGAIFCYKCGKVIKDKHECSS